MPHPCACAPTRQLKHRAVRAARRPCGRVGVEKSSATSFRFRVADASVPFGRCDSSALDLPAVVVPSPALIANGDERDAGILALRHQVLVVQRQVSRPRFTETDWTILAVLSAAFSRRGWTK
jgi:hypothetical protein